MKPCSFLAIILVFVTAGSYAFASGKAWTDVGHVGNLEILIRYQDYLSHNTGCQASGSGRRAIITGFGLFSGVTANVSGAVVESLATDQPGSGRLSANDHVARVYNREFVLGGERVSACLIIVDVMWDLAGAVIATEMQRFQPAAVVMTGLGGMDAVLEAGALNRATDATGFNSDGSPDSDNLPAAGSPILPTEPLIMPMTWNNRELAEHIRQSIQQLGFDLEVPDAARASNDYICNNVSYIALSAAAGLPLNLAGGSLGLLPKIKSHPKIGFFHFPHGATVDANSWPAWAEILKTIAAGALN